MAGSNRRGFFRELLRQGAKTVAAFEEGMEEARQQQDFEKFFSSYDSSYALTLAEEELLLQTAEQDGIKTQGRDRNQIARDLFVKHKDG